MFSYPLLKFCPVPNLNIHIKLQDAINSLFLKTEVESKQILND
ncbi:hypothetical protein ABIB39_004398 [Mucilaginibacter sp. UYP27]